MTLDGQLKDEVYSFQQLLELLNRKNVRTLWERLAPYFPVRLDPKTYLNDLEYLADLYGITPDELKIQNQEDLDTYNRLVTTSRYGLLDRVESLISTAETYLKRTPPIRMEALKQAIKHDHLAVAKLLIKSLETFLIAQPTLVKELIILVSKNGSLELFQYCEQELDQIFTKKVEHVLRRYRSTFNLGFLAEQEKFIDYLDDHYCPGLTCIIYDACQ